MRITYCPASKGFWLAFSGASEILRDVPIDPDSVMYMFASVPASGSVPVNM